MDADANVDIPVLMFHEWILHLINKQLVLDLSIHNIFDLCSSHFTWEESVDL